MDKNYRVQRFQVKIINSKGNLLTYQELTFGEAKERFGLYNLCQASRIFFNKPGVLLIRKNKGGTLIQTLRLITLNSLPI